MRIQNKLFVAFLLAGISLVSMMFIAIEWSLTKGLLEFINTRERDAVKPFVEVLQNRYKFNSGWDWVEGRHRIFHELYREQVVDKNPGMLPPGTGPGVWNRRPPPERGQKPNMQKPHSPRHDGDRHRQSVGSNTLPEPIEQPPHLRRLGPDGERPRHIPPGQGGRSRPAEMALFNAEKQFVVGAKSLQDIDSNWLEITDDKQIVGYLVIPKRIGISDGYELQLLEQQRYSYFVIGGLLILLTIVIALPLARNLVLPIKELAAFMNRLAKGQYTSRLELKRNDELGHLSRDVNELAVTLEKNESARKRWIADISHELRTPIAVMKGEMEAVIDGIRPLDINQVESSHQEVQRLQRLVDDLYELSSADIGGLKYRKEEFDIVEMLDDDVPQFENILSRANMRLSTEIETEERVVWADADRLSQLFSNLMVNCAKYAGLNGEVKLSAQSVPDRVRITIEDNGPGVPDEHLNNLFEHLFRVDDSRNRKTGGSGLGLAICKQIVEAHQGTIWAEKSALGGLAVQVELPVV